MEGFGLVGLCRPRAPKFFAALFLYLFGIIWIVETEVAELNQENCKPNR